MWFFVLVLFTDIKRIKTAHNLPQQAAQVWGQIFIQKQQQQLKTTQWPTFSFVAPQVFEFSSFVSLIEPGGLSVLWALLSSIIVADKSKEEMYMVFLTKVMKKLCNTGTHSITIGSKFHRKPGQLGALHKLDAPGKFKRSSQAAKSLHTSSFRITQQPRAVCARKVHFGIWRKT